MKGNDEVPPYETLEGFEEHTTSKFKCLVTLADHLLADDTDNKPFTFPTVEENGTVSHDLVYPLWSQGVGDIVRDPNAKGKLVVYVEFVQLVDRFIEVSSF